MKDVMLEFLINHSLPFKFFSSLCQLKFASKLSTTTPSKILLIRSCHKLSCPCKDHVSLIYVGL